MILLGWYKRGILLKEQKEPVWRDAGCRIRKLAFRWRQYQSPVGNCTQADMLFQPVSRMQPGLPALSTQHIRGTRPYLMWRGWHHLESWEEIQPMINSSSDNTMEILALCLPLQTSLLNSGLLHATGLCNKAVNHLQWMTWKWKQVVVRLERVDPEKWLGSLCGCLC